MKAGRGEFPATPTGRVFVWQRPWKRAFVGLRNGRESFRKGMEQEMGILLKGEQE
jgi:hypothetical protein